MKRILALLLAALLAVTALAGCDAGPDDPYIPTGDGLTWDDPSEGPTGTDPEAPDAELTTVYSPDSTYNPYFSANLNNRAWMSLIYQGLFAVDSEYTAHPILCESFWRSPDMMTYVFYLRSDAAFSDGTPVTQADVKSSLDFALESARYKGRFGHVSSVSATEGNSITVKLDTPYADLPLLLDMPILKQTELNDIQPLGSGPFRLTQSAAGIRLVRVSNWWADATLPFTGSAITLKSAADPTKVRDEFERADVDLALADPGDPNYAAFRCDCELWDCESGVFLYLAVNINSKIFGKADIRSALTHAIDREALVEEFYHGYARSATLAASPLSPWYDSILAADYGYAPERFTQALADAGLEEPKIRLLVNSADPQRVLMARRVAAMLESCGLPVTVVSYTGDDYRYTLNIGNYDLHLGKTRLSPNMDLSAFFSGSGALNYGSIDNARLYALCLDALANEGNYYNLLKDTAQDGRLVPILFETYAVYGERGVVSDLAPARDNVFYYDLGNTAGDVRLDARKEES